MSLRFSRRPRWLLLAAALLTCLALTSCGALGQDSPAPTLTSTPRSVADLDDSAWADAITDVDCSPMNMGVEVLGIRFADVRGQGVQDAFVWVDCVHNASTWPHQLEVFDGSSDPAHPKRLGVLLTTKDDLFVQSMSFSGSTVTVDNASYADQDALCCPSRTLQTAFTWSGDHFERMSG